MKKLLICIISMAFILTGCTSGSDVALKVGDVKVKKEYIDYFADSFSNQTGGTVSETAKQLAQRQAEIYAQYIAVGTAMGLDPEEKYNTYVENVLGTDGNLDDFLETRGISKELFDFVIYGDAYRAVLVDACKGENELTSESEDEYFKNNYWRAKHLLLTTQNVKSEEKTEIKEKIDKLYADVKNGADFDALIDEYNEDPGVESNPNGYIFTDGKMVAEFQEGVSSIEIGEYNLVETSYGYHIVKRLALDETPELYDEFKASVISEIDQALVGELFTEFINSKIDEFQITTLDYTGSATEKVAK